MTETKELTFDDIVKADDKRPVPFGIPEWGGRIWFKPMGALKAIEFRKRTKEEGISGGAFIIEMFAASACDKNGAPLCQDEEQATQLYQKNMAVFLRAQDTLLVINGMAQPDKSWASVKSILEKGGVPGSVVEEVAKLWAEDTAEEAKKS